MQGYIPGSCFSVFKFAAILSVLGNGVVLSLRGEKRSGASGFFERGRLCHQMVLLVSDFAGARLWDVSRN